MTQDQNCYSSCFFYILTGFCSCPDSLCDCICWWCCRFRGMWDKRKGGQVPFITVPSLGEIPKTKVSDKLRKKEFSR